MPICARRLTATVWGRGSTMFGAFFRLLMRVFPFLGRLLSTSDEAGHERKKPFPKAKVAIVGAGVGGCSAAYFLREIGGENLDVHVYSDGQIGGRAAVVEFDGHMYESGASVIHTSNKYLMDFTKQFGLKTQVNKGQPTTPLGIFDGTKFVFRLGTSSILNALKLFWRYGFSLIRLNFHVHSMIKKFSTIYKMQLEEGRSFATVPDMLRAMGGDDMYQCTQLSAEEYLVNNLGWSELMVDELVAAALLANYGQNTKVDAFTTLVALAGMEDGSLWNVVGGNKLVPENALKASGATFHAAKVDSVTREASEGKPTYLLEYTDLESEEKQKMQDKFDVVIVAHPLNLSSVKFDNFPSPVYTPAATTPYHRTVSNFIKGEINPSFFGLKDYSDNFPLTILTKELEGCPIDFRSVAVETPSEIPNEEVKNYLKPLKEDPVRMWKVFSPNPLTDEEKSEMFQSQEDEGLAVDWQAYPEYDPPEECPPFILDDGVFYINAVEKAASAMEMSAIGAKNAALLTKEYLIKKKEQ